MEENSKQAMAIFAIALSVVGVVAIYAMYQQTAVISGAGYWKDTGLKDMYDLTGRTQACEAKLQVCFGGVQDQPVATVRTTGLCDNACDNTQTPNQNACSYAECQLRCYGARVSGYEERISPGCNAIYV